MKNYKEEVARLLYKNDIGLEYEEILNSLEIPPDNKMGDFAFPCFKLAKIKRNAPNKIAEEIKANFETNDFLDRVENVGPYLNFYLNRQDLIKNVVEEVLNPNGDFFAKDLGKGKNVIVEFSSTNIAKPFHIGHIRSTVQGNAIRNIYKHLGFNTIAVNYIGDHGTQFGIMIAAYKLWGNDEKIKANPIQELLKLYVDYNALAKEDQTKMDEARAWFAKLEAGDKEAVELWTWFKEISLNEFKRVYDMLGIEFDSYNGESFSSQFIDGVIKELREKNLLVDSEGAEIIDLESDGLPNVIVIKSDGTSTYIARDIATALYRKREYDYFKNIYVVASQQNLHFQQLVAILKKMGYDFAEACIHTAFGMVSLKDQTLSTRKGQVVFLEDVLNKAVEKTLEIIDERNPNLENKEEVAKEVGIGAVMFQELSNNKIKDYIFDWDITLNFEGETGPYVQYTVARANSILNKLGQTREDIDYLKLVNKEEFELANSISLLPQRIEEAMEKYEPSYVTRQLIDIAKNFNKFYNNCPILKEDVDMETKQARARLVRACRDALKLGLSLLGIKSPEKM